MSGLKDIVKGGWHPDKDVPIKDSLKGLVGKGKKDEKTYHTPTPITSLRDPASFPPPPKHIATGATPSPPPGQPYRPPAAGASHQSYGSTYTTQHQPAEEAPPAPKPYRVDTTGLSTSHLPPPPRRTGGTASTPSPPPAYAHAKPPPPSLPPRLPPRTSTPTSPARRPPSPTRSSQPDPKPQGYLNQSAINNLSSRGISVPGFGIGSPAPASTTPQPPQVPSASTGTASPGTTWAQKRAALQTASSLHKEPSSVSASDAASAASTFNNFHQRHGDQVGSVAGRVNAFTSGDRAAPPPHTTPTTTPSTAAGPIVGKKKPPPPPPPAKKPALAAATTHGARQEKTDDAPPPPVPLATRPRF